MTEASTPGDGCCDAVGNDFGGGDFDGGDADRVSALLWASLSPCGEGDDAPLRLDSVGGGAARVVITTKMTGWTIEWRRRSLAAPSSAAIIIHMKTPGRTIERPRGAI